MRREPGRERQPQRRKHDDEDGLLGSVRLLVVLLLTATLPVHAATVEASATITATGLAVAETEQGLVGTTAHIEATALRGSGSVFVDTRPLSETDMQASARLAARVAADTLGLDWRRYDVLIQFRSASPVIGGPSAGGVMAMAVAAALWSLEHPDDPWQVDQGVAATGTINLDGTIGPVGGVPVKAQGAARAGLHTVLYPAGQEQVVFADGSTTTMSRFCRDLDIQCTPAASIADLIRVAADRVIQRPDPVVPGTADFPQLESSVDAQIDALDQRLAATSSRTQAPPGPEVAAALDDAQARLAEAREHADNGAYYLAATLAFRGLIQQRYASALLDLEADTSHEVVAGHVGSCAGSVAALDVAATASDWTSFFAIAAAQVRVDMANDLLQQAQQRLATAATLDDWRAALLQASFCQERADTVTWWASLRDLFPAGAPVQDAPERTQEAIVRAADMVAYALSVQGSAGGAPALLEQAREHHEAQRHPAAMLYTVQAEAAASASLQSVGGGVPDAVLSEARDAASRAVARARSEGIEPVLAVALIELASIQPPADALLDLWTARGVALAATQVTAPAPDVRTLPSSPDYPGLVAALGLAALGGIVLGAGGSAVAFLLVRRP